MLLKSSLSLFKRNGFDLKFIVNTVRYEQMKNESGFVINKKATTVASPFRFYNCTDKQTSTSGKGCDISLSYVIMFSSSVMITEKTVDDKIITKRVGIYFPLDVGNFMKMRLVLKNVSSWFDNDKTDNHLFTYDVNDRLVGVRENQTIEVVRNRGFWLAFKPAVSFTDDGSGFESVLIKCDKGNLITLTSVEFNEFREQISNAMNNYLVLGQNILANSLMATKNSNEGSK